ncbi:hypothetical protein PSN45_002012 [Yamadazyma tenuis]|nr:hypothetical protein PSN45_002012 [Yamadazyma tenuis]
MNDPYDPSHAPLLESQETNTKISFFDSFPSLFDSSQSESESHECPESCKLVVSFSYDRLKLIAIVRSSITKFEDLVSDTKYKRKPTRLEYKNKLAVHGGAEEKPEVTYLSRISLFQLSRILNLSEYDINLTKTVQHQILDVFTKHCDFRLGYDTWVKHTDESQRDRALSILYEFFRDVYPFTKKQLQVVIRRGSYRCMQSRLRRDKHSALKKILRGE